MDEETRAPSPFGRLMHRWFVQYNPLYLASAALVALGLRQLSLGVAADASAWGRIGICGVAEAYAFALIAAAAVLTRRGLRRPAVFVSLIAALYQGDLWLGTEAFALFGRVGQLASLIWLVLFMAKIRALSWALRLRLSASALAVPGVGAFGLAVIPHLSRHASPQIVSAAVCTWTFVLFASALWTGRSITSGAPLDGWGATVLRRATRAVWILWASLVCAHATVWVLELHLRAETFVAIGLLLVTRWVRRERGVLAWVVAACALIALRVPEQLWTMALLSALLLALHALRKPAILGAVPLGWRSTDATWVVLEASYAGAPSFARAPPAALARQLAWAAYALYVAIWTFGWRGGAWPAHVPLLECALLVGMAFHFLRSRRRVVVVPMLGCWLHWGIQTGLLRAPRSHLQWGLLSVGLGFGTLVVSVIASHRLEGRPGREGIGVDG